MKITEIISENKTDEGAVSSVLGYMANPLTTRSMAGAAKSLGQNLPFKNAKQATRAGEKTAKSVRKMIPFASKGGWVHKSLSKFFVGRNLKALEMARAEVARDAIGIFGNGIIKLFMTMNIFDAVIDYYAAKKVLEANPPSDFDDQMNKLRGTLAVQILAPGIAVGGMKLAGALVNIIPGLLKMMPGKTLPRLGIGTNIVVDILTKIGAAGMLAYVMSDEGKQALGTWLSGIIDGIGWMSSSFFTLLEGLVAFYEVYTGKEAPSVIKKALVQPKPNATTGASQANTTPNQGTSTGSASPAPASAGAGAGGGGGGFGSFDDMAADLFLKSLKSNQG